MDIRHTILTNNNLGICIQNGIPTRWDINETCIGMHWEYYIGKYWGYNGKPTIMEMCSWYFGGKCSISMGTWRGCRRQIVRCNVYRIMCIYIIIYIWVAFLLVPNILNGLQCWMNICIHYCTCSKHADNLNSDSPLSQMHARQGRAKLNFRAAFFPHIHIFCFANKCFGGLRH